MNREIGTPALIEESVVIIKGWARVTINLILIQQTIPIGIFAIEQLWSDSLDHQEFIQRFQWPVFGLIWWRKSFVIARFSTTR